MIKTFQHSDKNKLNDAVNFYLETDHFDVVDGSFDVFDYDNKIQFIQSIISKEDVIVKFYANGSIKSSSKFKQYEKASMHGSWYNNGKVKDGITFYFSPIAELGFGLEFEEGNIISGDYVEWYESSGCVSKYINYVDGKPNIYLEWYDDSVSPKDKLHIDIPVISIEDMYSDESTYFHAGLNQQLKMSGQFDYNDEGLELEKSGEWIKWNDKGEKVLNIFYKDGKIKNLFDESYFDVDPFPCHEDDHNERRNCGICRGPSIKHSPEWVDYDEE